MPAVTAPRIRFERWLRGGGLAILGLLVVLLFGLWLYVRQVERRRPSPILKITAGSIDTTRARVARLLMEQLATREIRTIYTEVVGSEAALDAIERGQIDLALIQGGLKLREAHAGTRDRLTVRRTFAPGGQARFLSSGQSEPRHA